MEPPGSGSLTPVYKPVQHVKDAGPALLRSRQNFLLASPGQGFRTRNAAVPSLCSAAARRASRLTLSRPPHSVAARRAPLCTQPWHSTRDGREPAAPPGSQSLARHRLRRGRGDPSSVSGRASSCQREGAARERDPRRGGVGRVPAGRAPQGAPSLLLQGALG